MRRILTIVVILATGVFLGRYLWPAQKPAAPLEETAANERVDATAGHAQAEAPYVCPMHPDVVSDKPGTCPVCGMALVQARQIEQDADEHDHAAHQEDMDAETGARPVVRIEPGVVNNLGVKTAPVKRTTLVRRIDTPGFIQQLQPGQNKRVTAPFDARIAAVQFTPGQWLEQGKPLVVLESETLRDAEQAHLAVLAQTATSAAAATPDVQSDAQSDAQLDTQGIDAKPTTLDASRHALSALGLSNADIQHLEQTREASAQLTVSTPYAAMVSNAQIAEGATVTRGALLFELTGMARASVLANAFQRDAAWIQTGQPVEVRLPHVSGEVWTGVVNQGAVSIDPDSQNIGVRLSFSAPTQLLKSAMYVVATIHGDVREGVLAVPQEALIRTEAEDRVVVAQGGGRFKPVPVRVGIETGGQVEILGGLEEGDEVVVSAQFLIDSESSLQASFLRMSGQVAQ